ncbi:hypothetical protein [Rhodococcus sp. IEGM 1330]|uniref:hypothetical protein n=1 Tax=Rhodococcus sp. IEGM 1330 TaxID=3082225 RepID=UPI00295399A8|nr:hypothetical protein [Rhodococcus sp. IEGM 1330]MDV8022317.1 hypothetical protein [Rhodococcus sp. IEGM 1330]
MSASWEIVGSVEILRMRVYPLDHRSDGCGTNVCVQPGSYPVYRKHDRYCYVMDGRINERFEPLGDGLFALHSGDNPSGLPVSFPCPPLDRDALNALILDTGRFRFHIPGLTS